MAATLAWLERRRRLHEQTGLAWYGLWDRRDATFIGTSGAFLGRCGDQPEIGYEIAENRRGHDYAAEAADLVTRACHATGHEEIWATIRPANVASVRTVQAIGFLLVRTGPDAKGPLDYYCHTAGEAP